MTDSEHSVSHQLASAAAALTGTDQTPETTALLHYFGYHDAAPDAAAAHARMLKAAAAFRRLFRLPMPDAPGLIFFGAQADPADLGPHNTGLPIGGFAGSGLHPGQAFESCVGEGIEYLSQFAQPDDPMQSATIDTFAKSLDPAIHHFVQAIASACRIPPGQTINWTPVRCLADGSASWFPTDLCLRRTTRDFVPPLKLSTGCAAGITHQAATLHATLELIERDAVALWWRGGQPARTIEPDSDAGRAATTLLDQIRRTRNDRQTTLLDITTDLGIPVVAAFSTRQDGQGFALGLGARTTQPDAARSAIFEMCQSELSLHVIAAKQREAGTLNESDQRQLTRAAALNPRTCPLLRPADRPSAPPPDLSGDPMEAITQRLVERGIITYSLDLTRPRFAVPVVRVIAPGLQSEPSEITSDRLALTIQQTGGGAKHSGGIVLL